MFAASRFNQAVDRVIGVLAARLDALILEVNGLLGVVADGRDVAHRVIGVAEVLHLTAGPAGGCRLWAITREIDGVAPGEQTDEPEGERVVVVGGAGAVAVMDALALALGVVVD